MDDSSLSETASSDHLLSDSATTNTSTTKPNANVTETEISIPGFDSSTMRDGSGDAAITEIIIETANDNVIGSDTLDISSSDKPVEKKTEVSVVGYCIDLNSDKMNPDILVEVKNSIPLNTVSHQVDLDKQEMLQTPPALKEYQVVVNIPKSSDSVLNSNNTSSISLPSDKSSSSSSVLTSMLNRPVMLNPTLTTSMIKKPKSASVSKSPSASKSPPTSQLPSAPVQKKSDNSFSALCEGGGFKSPSDHLLSQIPLMNSMVQYQLQRLLQKRANLVVNSAEDLQMRKRPVAVLTAYSVKKVPLDKVPNGGNNSNSNRNTEGRPVPPRIFYKDFLPIDCEYLKAVIHLDKFYCPGTYRPCIEFEGTLISPYDLLQKIGLNFTANWKLVFRAKDGKSLKVLFDKKKLDFKNHDVFCTGGCKFQVAGQPPTLKTILNDLSGSGLGEKWVNQMKKRKTEAKSFMNLGWLQQTT